jgi:hypothetical protein
MKIAVSNIQCYNTSSFPNIFHAQHLDRKFHSVTGKGGSGASFFFKFFCTDITHNFFKERREFSEF